MGAAAEPLVLWASKLDDFTVSTTLRWVRSGLERGHRVWFILLDFWVFICSCNLFFPPILTVRACFPLLLLLIAEGLPVGFTEGEEWFWFVLRVFKGFGRTQRTELQTQRELAELGITCC